MRTKGAWQPMSEAEKKRQRERERAERQKKHKQEEKRRKQTAQKRAVERSEKQTAQKRAAERSRSRQADAAEQRTNKDRRHAEESKSKKPKEKVDKPRRVRRKREISPEKLQKRRERRQKIYRILSRIGFFLVLIGAAVAALTLFFKVDRIELVGTDRYSKAQIVSQISIDEGDNLYLWDKISVSDTITTEFPYVQDVQIRRKLPNRIVISVTECTAALAVQSGTGYYLLSDNGKILEYTDDPGELIAVSGVSLSGRTPGEYLSQDGDETLGTLNQILELFPTIEEFEIARVDFINLESLLDIRIGVDERFDIRVGAMDSGNGFVRRMSFAVRVIGSKLSPSDIGRLYWDARDRLHFVPDTLENVQKSASGTLTENALEEASVSEADESAEGEAEGDIVLDDAEQAGDSGENTGEERGEQEEIT